MTTAVLRRRGVRALLAFAVAAAVAVPGLGAASPARADTPDGTTKVVEVKLDYNYTGGNVAGYHTALIRLRQAAGRQFRDDDVYITQATPPGLIALRLQDRDGNELSSLYFNPANLYVGGFRTRSGKLYAFNDASENVRTEMGRGGQVNTLGFGGSYGSLISTAGDEPTVEWLNGFIGSAETVGRADQSMGDAAGRASVARSLLKLIGAFSEAARFTDFRDTWDPVVAGRNGGAFFEISNTRLRALRGAWGAISQFAIDLTTVPSTPPLTVNGVGTFATWQDVRDHLRVIRR
ncbi:ribosome-inactivating family protein [Kitasatospora sp. NPDC059463]|uniref:ribosome-inactivating family protein n=1 Tax=unclassified Kitasatospora TaxID=2633591 RepID=UPI0036C638F7